MKIKFFCPIWGSENMDIKSFFAKVKDSGYDGVEMGLPIETERKEEVLALIKQFELQLIAQHWETLTADYEAHKKEYRHRLENLATGNPLFINTQTGKDFFTYEQNAGLIQIADEVSSEYGVKIIHETHRGKFSFAAHITSQFLKKIPGLRLGLDISHWCNVAESWLDDQSEALSMALLRADHIHARVGFPEGPQIPDPRAPEWKEALDKHLGWWNQVIDQRRKDGWTEFTITPEFGPYPYMTILPFNKQPIADQWDVNLFMMQFLKSAFNE
ncbi:MAG: sugar phosphate isomerase/epimerase [Prolixibacteraceae bacterium]|jgi:sugar phosphate isomerase/epimerase|nr:sugar phosphate isomerase/epimerase [Prolixibacteraceae bacterium]